MKKQNKLDKWFLLTWKKVWIIVVSAFLSIVLHNAIYALFYNYFQSTGGDEAFFLILAVIIIPLYFLTTLVYTLIRKISSKKKK